ncbi:MAG: hypothetical protein DRP73_04310 [Candidatus Omnitrophota bacterium]|nr:MAG: hypothetical protein DRP73_04310 [Candidatus Omnitrophota bacterium]
MKKLLVFVLVMVVITVIVLLVSIKPVNYTLPEVVVRKVTIEREQKVEGENFSQEEKMKENEMDKSQKYVEGEVLVKFKQDLTPEEIDTFLSQYDLRVKKIISGIGVYNLELPQGVKVEDIIEKLKQDQRVEYAEPNYLFKLY